MVNALFDHSSSGSSGSGSGTGVEVNGDVKSITTESFEVIDTSDDGIVLALSKFNGCDINTETTIQPTADQSTALVVNNSSGVALAMISDSTGLLTSKPIGMIVNNNTLLENPHYLSGAELNVIGSAPVTANLNSNTYRSRVTIGTKGYNYGLGAAIDTVATGIMIQGGMAGDFGTQVTAAFGSISVINPTMVGVGYTVASREIMRFQIGNDNYTKMVGINIYTPTAALHVKNSSTIQNVLALDSAAGVRLCTMNNAGDLTITGNVTLQTAYSSSPTQYQLGYLKEFKNTSAVAMAATTVTTICSMDVPPGIWMITGVAEFMPSGTPTFCQCSICPSTATANTFDDFTQVAQFPLNSAGGVLVSLPMKYYCGSATKTFEVRALCGGITATANHNTGYSSVLRAVRVG